MLGGLDDALKFLRDFHSTALQKVDGFRVVDANIPEPLRKVYAVFGETRSPGSPIGGQDMLAGPSQLRRIGDYVHFLDECQGCWSCAYHVDGGPDPAVFLFGDEAVPSKQSDSLESFLVTYLLQESVMAAPHFASQEEGVMPEEALIAAVEPLWLDATYSRPNPTHSFYWSAEPGILIMRFHGDYAPWLWLGSYEDRWDSVFHDCSGGFVVSDTLGNERRVHSSSQEKAVVAADQALQVARKGTLKSGLMDHQQSHPVMKLINDILWHLSTPLFIAVMALSMWGLFGFDTPFNAPFIWAWRHLALPVLGIGWLYGLLQRDYFLRGRRVPKVSFWFCLVALPPIILLFSGGIVSLVNGSFPTQDTVTYRGPITRLYVSGGLHKENQVVLTDPAAGEITLGVSPSEYATLAVGQTYTRGLRVGLLGIPFRNMRERR